MADTSDLSRDWKLDVDISGTWTRVKGLRGFAPLPVPVLEDDADYDTGGWASVAKTGMAWSANAELIRRKDDTSFARDPGQEKLRTAAEDSAMASTVSVRYYKRDGIGEAKQGTAHVTWAPQSGSRTNLAIVQVTLTGVGALVDIANPDA